MVLADVNEVMDKKQVISWLVEELLASQEQSRSMILLERLETAKRLCLVLRTLLQFNIKCHLHG